MEFLNTLKDALPDYAKDIRLNIDSAIARSSLENTEAVGVALACAFAAHCRVIVAAIRNAGVLSAEEQNGALTAAALMGMNNIWYPYPEMADDAELNDTLRKEGLNTVQLRDIDRIAATIYAVAQVIAVEHG
ncbi:putative Alkyl hydroperoxide reductase ahpD [Candidatus Glomeribacter gigasporarum BEG34]|uniref:Putative Alkyl hydroperoxide reductase ahpD n=1 Tax=Candidatus Glomeribacter gigasporarum BEG34 TaxID=1070319 RepID=G2J8D9_9BURK|nr:hypothetical protein [Candidatus Glomeribacter gigasporarum]CCD29036.1 putative Alkyl hydroperoxide reductase ahpD [Candidatus Glomeribacter gigasporarum BEG34]